MQCIRTVRLEGRELCKFRNVIFRSLYDSLPGIHGPCPFVTVFRVSVPMGQQPKRCTRSALCISSDSVSCHPARLQNLNPNSKPESLAITYKFFVAREINSHTGFTVVPGVVGMLFPVPNGRAFSLRVRGYMSALNVDLRHIHNRICTTCTFCNISPGLHSGREIDPIADKCNALDKFPLHTHWHTDVNATSL